MIVPAEIGREAAIADGPVVYGVSSLAEAVEVLEGSVRIHPMWSMSPTCSNQEAVARADLASERDRPACPIRRGSG